MNSIGTSPNDTDSTHRRRPAPTTDLRRPFPTTAATASRPHRRGQRAFRQSAPARTPDTFTTAAAANPVADSNALVCQPWPSRVAASRDRPRTPPLAPVRAQAVRASRTGIRRPAKRPSRRVGGSPGRSVPRRRASRRPHGSGRSCASRAEDRSAQPRMPANRSGARRARLRDRSGRS